MNTTSVWEQTAAALGADIQSSVTYFPTGSVLSKQRRVAAQHGVSPETLLNWMQEGVGQADAALRGQF